MKRSFYAFAAAALLAATVTATAHAETSVGVRISVGDPYRGATLTFRSEPDVVLVPDTKVYYVHDRDYDLYRYGRYWYYVEDGYWYRSAGWRGPFRHVRSATVPRSIVRVPVNYRRHWHRNQPPHAMARAYGHDRRADQRVERRVERRTERRDARRDVRREVRRDDRQADRRDERVRDRAEGNGKR